MEKSKQTKIQAFKDHVIQISSDPGFVHHKWFVKWHLNIVENMALELADLYPKANRDLVQVMAWLHDYGKVLDYDRQYERDLVDKGRDKLLQLGFDGQFANKAADYVHWQDHNQTVDLKQAPIEVQIVATADGCSHMVGPFMYTIWHEATDKSFAGKTMEELMAANQAKVHKDWSGKIVLPEARQMFEARRNHILEVAGNLPKKFFS